jgi:hypothetical protein
VRYVVVYRLRSRPEDDYSAEVVDARSTNEAIQIALEGEFTDDGAYVGYASPLTDLDEFVAARSSSVAIEVTT